MVTKLFTCQVEGMSARLVEVETDILMGLSAFNIVGLGDAAVQESKERVRSAIKNSGAQYPQQKKIINLAPAHVKKYGPHFDLPMALGLLIASQQLKSEPFENTLIAGELALDGSVRPIKGIISLALFAKKNGYKLLIPSENQEEASLVEGVEIKSIRHLSEITRPQKPPNKKSRETGSEVLHTQTTIHNKNTTSYKSIHSSSDNTTFQTEPSNHSTEKLIDLADIRGQEQAKRALIIAAVGGHHILMCGPPGIGKTMLGKAFAALLPPLQQQQALEVLQVYSIAGLLHALENKEIKNGTQSAYQASFPSSNHIVAPTLNIRRPFRSVHPTAAVLALTGGGIYPRPGEISLAHHGVLFLDEFAEFPRPHLESLRMPLEEKKITISRSAGTVTWPAAFTLVAAMNPCPCGYFGDTQKPCRCRPHQREQYSKKISGPILDRIDLWLELTRPQEFETSLTSKQARTIIQKALLFRKKREESTANSTTLSAQTEAPQIPASYHSTLQHPAYNLLIAVAESDGLSERAKQKIVNIARTIADINAHPEIQLEDIAEACQYRRRTLP